MPKGGENPWIIYMKTRRKYRCINPDKPASQSVFYRVKPFFSAALKTQKTMRWKQLSKKYISWIASKKFRYICDLPIVFMHETELLYPPETLHSFHILMKKWSPFSLLNSTEVQVVLFLVTGLKVNRFFVRYKRASGNFGISGWQNVRITK